MRSERKFLIIRLGAIGDIVHALPLADAIKTYYKDARVDWVVGDKFVDIVKNNPLIDNVYVANLSMWRKNWLSPNTIKDNAALNKILQAQNYDVSIDAHGMFKTLVIQAFCGAKKRIGYKDYREFAPLGCNILVEPESKRPHTNYHVVKRHLDLLEKSGILTEDEIKGYAPKAFLPPSSPETVKKIDELLSFTSKKPMIIFAPATTWVNKHWDEKNWSMLYQMLKNDADVVFSGVKKDIPLIERITGSDKNAKILAGKTNLIEYIELLRRADIIVSPDSSAAHLGWACNKPKVVTIFCATSKHTYAPLGQTAFPAEKENCTPCHKRKCRKKECICTNQTSADEVFGIIKKMLHWT
jgi:lipopolysaccharide heptosyltransferase I